MKMNRISARDWTGIGDFYEAMLIAIEAPGWHGRNTNALIDSMIYGEINGLSPPYKITITDSDSLTSSLRNQIAAQLFYILQARDEAPFVNRPKIMLAMQ